LQIKRKTDRQIANRLNVDAILTTLACRLVLPASGVLHASQS